MMKYLLFIFTALFIISCNTAEIDNDNVIETTPRIIQKEQNKGDNFILLSNDPALERFLLHLKKNVESQNIKGIYSQIDPLQMGVQSQEMEMDSCQNVKELFNLRLKEFHSNCELIKGISNWKYKGYKKVDTATFDVRGETKLNDGTIQEFSLLINQLDESTFVITGAVG